MRKINKSGSAKLLAVASELSAGELDVFIRDVLALRAQRQGPSLPREEAVLLEKINKSLPAEQWQRYETLQEKRGAETLTEAEHRELLDLIQKIEALDVHRMKHLTRLAQLRRVSVRELMRQIGL